MRPLLDLLVPSCCDGCGARAAPPWCEDCAAVAAAMRPRRPCHRCAGEGEPGHPCWQPDAMIAATVALTAWSGPIATALVRAKLDARMEVFRSLGPALADCAEALPVDVVVPVPSDRHRVRERGADHTAVLARAVASALRLPYVPALRAVGRQLDRGAARGGRVDRVSRHAHGTVVVGRPAAVAGCAVLLVDDLVTTGTTLTSCAAPLIGAGAAWVGAAVLARAGHHPLGRSGTPTATRTAVGDCAAPAPGRAEDRPLAVRAVQSPHGHLPSNSRQGGSPSRKTGST